MGRFQASQRSGHELRENANVKTLVSNTAYHCSNLEYMAYT